MVLTTSGVPPAPSGFFHFLSSHKLDLILVLSVLLFVYALIAPPTPVCQVIITGESVKVLNCPAPDKIIASIQLAPWNGVKFPIL
ncbi:ORF 4 [Malva mosaic virus]|uniref:Movement protein TGBp3 n=1 Tax=Malva mosaic virus TaxID=392174 RepID=Q0Z8V2_9VIRU|nr:ORF 4 [Malva mosaic virus]ABG48663.1 ORF 4 [Malva mosaic virus]